ncbi:MAG: single-stranded-DNA-specific exonuclease RecJ [Candidatus Kaiserbacteria bacterium]|nr:MAG: single-stranded-DNA-specific exonuclease RecJ [Candidatus Kaiserbacteria bacterium]
MEVSEFLRTLLSKRGIDEEHRIAEFLNPDYDLHLHSPFTIFDMERAVTRLLLAIQQNERIAVYADFDCDGIPGAAVLSDFFTKIGHENFEVYLPHRDREGYGFHAEALAALAARGVSLIITVDVGTNAAAEVEVAKKLGVDVIVTDHHEVTGVLPDCVAVLNPKLGEYPFRDLCGAAVAWKLVQAALVEGRQRGIPSFTQVADGWEKWLLDLVAIATVADLVPLVGENRVLAHWGLRVLRKSPRLGLQALCNSARVKRADILEDDIAFSIAPRINAASRMDEPDAAFRLLTTRKRDEAEKIAAHLEDLNAKRKGIVAGIVRQAKKSVKQRFSENDQVIVVGNPEWKPALLGLAANSIMEERGGLVCVWGRDAKGRIKGSCRSDGSVSVVDCFAAADEAFVEYGGHRQSGGFTLREGSVHTLPETLAKAAADSGAVAIEPKSFAADAILALSEISWSLYEDLSRMGPFGIGNQKPIFLVADGIVTEVRRFGKEKNHVELMLECRKTGSRARAFQFFRSPEQFTLPPTQGLPVGVTASLERDSYRGGLTLRLVDVLQSNAIHSEEAQERAGMVG